MENIEPIRPENAEAVCSLSIEAGWNQNAADWRFMLAAGRGYGVKNGAGAWEASALVLPLGPKLSWISMVLVTEARRRGGIGTALLKRCIAEVRAGGAVAGLDATEHGRPIYLALGFHDLYGISRWHLAGATDAVAAPAGIRLRRCTEADMPLISSYDGSRSGMQRSALLVHLAGRRPDLAWLAEDRSGNLAGYALGREGRTAQSIGPIIADSEAVGLALLAGAATASKGPFIVDSPDAHVPVRRWLGSQGARTPRAYTRMTLGTAIGLDDPAHVFALAGPELG